MTEEPKSAPYWWAVIAAGLLIGAALIWQDPLGITHACAAW